MASLTEGVLYYDCEFETRDGILELDRIYAIDDARFTDTDYENLGAIYAKLPGFLPTAPYPCWFGLDESARFYLTASMETPGIQICGRVSAQGFKAWERQFHALLTHAGLPFRRI